MPAVARFWVARGYGDAVLKNAKETAGDNMDAVTAFTALHNAARRHGLTLTDHVTAMADEAVAQLDAAMEQMRTSGQLQIFNRMYRVYRDAAGHQRGRHVMTYKTALGRLQRALIPHLTGQAPPVEGLFERVFG